MIRRLVDRFQHHDDVADLPQRQRHHSIPTDVTLIVYGRILLKTLKRQPDDVELNRQITNITATNFANCN